MCICVYICIYIYIYMHINITSGASRETCTKRAASAVRCDVVLHRALRARRPNHEM